MGVQWDIMHRDVEAYVKTMDRMPPPAPARAWATLSFGGITGFDATGAIMMVV